MKKILIVVDMQNDFIHLALSTREALTILPRVQKKIREAVEQGTEIIFTRDTHEENYLDTQEGKKLPVPHCIRGTRGWELYPGLYVPGSQIIDKPTFGWLDWQLEADAVEMVGLCTDICVVSNALILKARYPEMEITVDAACCAGVTPESHEAALKTMKSCQILVINEGIRSSTAHASIEEYLRILPTAKLEDALENHRDEYIPEAMELLAQILKERYAESED